ncbi:hypothetical protein EBQ74_08435 [bacterium]|nr:hypothetical protein [bacterium]
MPNQKLSHISVYFLFTWLAMSSALAEVGEPCARVAGVVGMVSYNQGYAIANGEKLNQGSQIRTGENSRILLTLRDRSELEIGDNTELTLSACENVQDSVRINLALQYGIVRVKVSKDKKNQNREFKLNTPTSTLGVRGTEFYVTWQQDPSGLLAERVAVSEGKVEISSNLDLGNTLLVEKGSEFRAEGRIRESGAAFKVEPNGAPQVDKFTSSEQEELEEYFQTEYPVSSAADQDSPRDIDSDLEDKKIQQEDDSGIDFQNEDSFIDNQEGIRSEQYVRRAILSTIVNTTGKFDFNRIYMNHLMGFSAIYQMQNGPRKFTKYTSGMQGLSLGYVTKGGHAFELGLEASAVSNIFAGYRYIWRPEKFSMWPFFGAGVGTEISSVRLSQGPSEAESYGRLGGMKQMGFGTLGVLIPVVEVGIKAELRANFYGFDRMVLTQGLGLIIFI